MGWKEDRTDEMEREQDLGRTGMTDVREKELDESRWERRKRQKRERAGSGRYRLTGALGAKIFAFFLLVASGVIGIWGLVGCIYIGGEGFYENSLEEVLVRQLHDSSHSFAYYAADYMLSGNIKSLEAVCGERNADLQLILLDGEGGAEVLWSTWDGYDTKYITDVPGVFHHRLSQEDVFVDGVLLDADKEYMIRVYVDPSFPAEDSFSRLDKAVRMVYDARYMLIGAAVGGILVCIFSFLFLMCGAGHQNGKEGITPGVLAAIPFDVLTLLFGSGGAVAVSLGMNAVMSIDSVTAAIVVTCMGAALAVWGTFYCMEFATRLKCGRCFRHTLIYWGLWGVWRMLRFLGRGFVALLRGLPLVMTVVIAYLGLCILELFGIMVFLSGAEELSCLLWVMEKVVLFVVVVYIALACRKLLVAGRALAEGEADYKVDTFRLIWNFKEHGENLNSVGQGISKAVAERLKSERLKTELITNVSHDLKTPLTSIINYADLIYEETIAGGWHGAGNGTDSGNASNRSSAGAMRERFAESGDDSQGSGKGTMSENDVDGNEVQAFSCADNIESIGTMEEGPMGDDMECGEAGGDGLDDQEACVDMGHQEEAWDSPAPDMSRIAEYAQVLLRQSRRLKKLLEDLLEASKATTGNLEVNLQPCEAGVLLSQAVGEYQQRMEERQLDLITRQPEEIAPIMADGRHLWRVFDNLLNNICKYAQERSRVYLSVEEREGDVLIIFRNMSKYPLDISVEELEERFVRGDKSRHMEGNGLGLSIAKSLVELQGGWMEITIDGDLFKVSLGFAAIS